MFRLFHAEQESGFPPTTYASDNDFCPMLDLMPSFIRFARRICFPPGALLITELIEQLLYLLFNLLFVKFLGKREFFDKKALGRFHHFSFTVGQFLVDPEDVKIT